MALPLHVDWFGEMVPVVILVAVILSFGVAAGLIGKRKGQSGGDGNHAARARR